MPPTNHSHNCGLRYQPKNARVVGKRLIIEQWESYTVYCEIKSVWDLLGYFCIFMLEVEHLSREQFGTFLNLQIPTLNQRDHRMFLFNTV